MRFRIWHVLFVLLIAAVVTEGVSYAQAPDGRRTREGAGTAAGQKNAEGFLKPGTTYYAVASATDVVHPTDGGGTTFLGPTIKFVVPATGPSPRR